MTRTIFERELRSLQEQVLSLGSLVEENIVKVVGVLLARDEIVARRLIAADKDVNERRIKIGLECLTTIARQQPMAGDMRLLAAVIEIVGELERIHDYVKGIARISINLGPDQIPQPFQEMMPQMAEQASIMLRRSMQAFADRDAELAAQIPTTDDEVDALFNILYQHTIEYVIANPSAIERANQLEWAVHNLERSADRVINICEWIRYMAIGQYVELDSEYEAPPPLTPGD